MPLSSAEWAIIRRYTHRIKELKVYLVDQESHWFLRVTGVQACPLFPNLRVLSWPARGAGFSASRSIKLLQRLPSPSLVSVDLVLTDMNDVMAQSFISGLYRRCPDLESVVIYHSNITGWKVSQTTIRSLSQTTSFLRYLECLCVDVPIDGVALTHIATSPKVKELKLVLHPDKSCLRQFRLPSDTIPFCNVRDLSLRIWDLDFLTTFLHTKDQAFRSFRLNLCSRPTIQALAVFLDVLASPQRTHSLQSLTLSLSLKESDEPQNITAHAHLPCDTLRPLARLSHLRELNINLNHCLFIDDHDLTSLARHWPLIQDLHLIGCSSPQDHISPPRTHITLYGLVSLVECCRHIRCLYLTVDATEVPLNTPPWIVRNPKLTHIWFIDSPIGLSEPVARFLHQHLPLLRGVFSSFHKPSVYGDAAARYEKAWSCAKRAIERSWYVIFLLVVEDRSNDNFKRTTVELR